MQNSLPESAALNHDSQAAQALRYDLLKRINDNIIRLEGYIQRLKSDIADPEKTSTPVSRDLWLHRTEVFEREVTALKNLLLKATAELENGDHSS